MLQKSKSLLLNLITTLLSKFIVLKITGQLIMPLQVPNFKTNHQRWPASSLRLSLGMKVKGHHPTKVQALSEAPEWSLHFPLLICQAPLGCLLGLLYHFQDASVLGGVQVIRELNGTTKLSNGLSRICQRDIEVNNGEDVHIWFTATRAWCLNACPAQAKSIKYNNIQKVKSGNI